MLKRDDHIVFLRYELHVLCFELIDQLHVLRKLLCEDLHRDDEHHQVGECLKQEEQNEQKEQGRGVQGHMGVFLNDGCDGGSGERSESRESRESYENSSDSGRHSKFVFLENQRIKTKEISIKKKLNFFFI